VTVVASATELTDMTATELAAAIRRRAVSSREVVAAFLARIESLDRLVNAVVYLDPDRAMKAAARVDRSLPTETGGRLRGVPVLLKDSHRVAGMPVVVGHPEASRRPAATDGYVATRLRREGALIIGKTNVPRDLTDFQTDNPVFGRTNNPWRLDRTAGGSSGGAAAAVAARMTPLEVGSDIAGSIRLPAHFCGVVGLKPTAGLFPGRGHVTEPVAHPRGGGLGALAALGPLARDFGDLALLLEVLSGRGAEQSAPDPSSIQIGVAARFRGLRVETAISAAVESLGAAAARHGGRVADVDLPIDFGEQQAAWVAVYEAASRRGAGWGAVRAAVRLRSAALEAWEDTFRRYDAMLCPPAMCVAFTHRPTGSPIEVDGIPVSYWGLARYASPFNLTGQPALVFPVGLDSHGVPIGVQVVAAHSADATVVALGRWLAALVPPLGSPPPPDA
jgi:amidase